VGLGLKRCDQKYREGPSSVVSGIPDNATLLFERVATGYYWLTQTAARWESVLGSMEPLPILVTLPDGGDEITKGPVLSVRIYQFPRIR